MRHHFGDFLSRDGGYWTIVPNRERYAYRIGDIPPGSKETTIVTIKKGDEDWSRVLSFPNLEEVTLHEPTAEQMLAIGSLRTVKRLRITHARPRSLDFIEAMEGVEELVLEYISGFSDLAPVGRLPRLRALHLENLRTVSDFGGLAGADGLRYLAIYGTTDWKQPVLNFEFLRGLPELEEFGLWEVLNNQPYPALLPVLELKRLKRLRFHRSYFPTEEYALLEEVLTGVDGANWGAFGIRTDAYHELLPEDARAQMPDDILRLKHPDVMIRTDGKRMIGDPLSQWYELTGKGERRIKCSSPLAEARCRDHVSRYGAMKQQARLLIKELSNG